MKKVLSWIKSNIPIVLLGAVVLVSVVALYFGSSQASQIITKAEKRSTKISQINRLLKNNVQLPAEQLGQEPIARKGTITENDTQLLTAIYTGMNDQKIAIYQAAEKKNQVGVAFLEHLQGHEPMVQGIFPEKTSLSKPFEAKIAYREAFAQMLRPYSPQSPYPNLDSGEPVAAEYVDEQLEQFQADYLLRLGATDENDLSQAERQKLRQAMVKHAMTLLVQQAQSIHIYASKPPREQDRDITFAQDVPFDLGAWSQSTTGNMEAPDAITLWQGQLNLWIQQDIVAVLARVNRTDDPSYHVINAPVKRLIEIEIDTQFVGEQGDGMVGRQGGRRSAKKDKRGGGPMMGYTPGTMDPMMMGRFGARGTTKKDKDPAAKRASPDDKLDEDFAISHTGRRSNASYDVLHARVILYVDSKRIPELLEAFSQVNFMTVLQVDLEDVDEYGEQGLQGGYLYGNDDVVELTLIIETLWLRSWTQQWMPPVVCCQLGMILPDDEGYVDPATFKRMSLQGRRR